METLQGQPEQDNALRELQLKEADWVNAELEETGRTLQRHRFLYVTTLLASIAWGLGHLVDEKSQSLSVLWTREDVALLVSFLPIVNALFTLLTLEASQHRRNLEGYLHDLGMRLGSGKDPWKWDDWSRSKSGSSYLWGAITDTTLGVVLLGVTAGALVFAFPAVKAAVKTGPMFLWVVWLFAGLVSLGVAVLAGVMAMGSLRRRRTSGVTSGLPRPPL